MADAAGFADDRVSMGEEVVADFRRAINGDKAVQHGVAADLRLIVDEAVRADVRAIAYARGPRNNRGGMEAGLIARGLVKKFDGVSEGEVRIWRAQSGDGRRAGAALEADAIFDEHRRSACGLEKREVAAVGEEGDLAGLGVFDAGNAADFRVGRTFQAAGKLLRNFREFHGRGSSYECESRISANKWRATLRKRRSRKVRAGLPNRPSAPRFFARRCARLRCRGTRASCRFANPWRSNDFGPQLYRLPQSCLRSAREGEENASALQPRTESRPRGRVCSGACCLATKFAGKFREETIHGDGRTSEESLQQGVDSAAFAGGVVSLQVQQSIDLPLRHALL